MQKIIDHSHTTLLSVNLVLSLVAVIASRVIVLLRCMSRVSHHHLKWIFQKTLVLLNETFSSPHT